MADKRSGTGRSAVMAMGQVVGQSCRWLDGAVRQQCAGHLPLEPAAAHLFFQLVSRRYEWASMLITSNRPVGEWGQVFGDGVAATAILDRLLHHSQVITIPGDSYRLRDKRRNGLLQKAAAPNPITSES